MVVLIVLWIRDADKAMQSLQQQVTTISNRLDRAVSTNEAAGLIKFRFDIPRADLEMLGTNVFLKIR